MIAGVLTTGKAVSVTVCAILVMSQLLALSNLQPGGMYIVTANMKPFLWNVEMLAML